MTSSRGDVIYAVTLQDGHMRDLSAYHLTDAYLQENGIQWGPHERLAGDSAYRGLSNITPGCSTIVQKFSAADIAKATRTQRETMENFNMALGHYRSASVELAIGGIKRGRVGDRSLGRQSLATSEPEVALWDEFAIDLHVAKMKFRGQKIASNPEVVMHPFEGINVPKKIIREYLQKGLFTTQGRKSAFHGYALTGLGNDGPEPLPLRG
jgi:hypothetical protein